MLTAIAVISGVAAIGSLIFSGWQSREVARQTQIGNQVAAASTLRDAVRHLDDTLAYLLEYPELRPCFYDDAAMPSDSVASARVQILAELIADCLDSTLWMARQLESFQETLVDWEKTARVMLDRSPALRAVILDAVWWPDLVSLAAEMGLPVVTTPQV